MASVSAKTSGTALPATSNVAPMTVRVLATASTASWPAVFEVESDPPRHLPLQHWLWRAQLLAGGARWMPDIKPEIRS